MPKISFIVAIYNVAEFIEECVRSLMEQTLEDIEIVLVDDHSPDGCDDICRRVIEQYPQRKNQVKLIRHDVNKGAPQARRTGLDASTGKYLIFIDGDDFVDKNMAAIMYQKAVETGADHVLCDYQNFAGDEMMGVKKSILEEVVGDGWNVRNDIINRRTVPFLVGKALLRDLFDNELIWPTKHMGDDTVLSSELAFWGKKFVHVPQPLYYYRRNMQSVSKKDSVDACLQRRVDFMENVEHYIKFLEIHGVQDEFGYGILTNKIRTKNRIFKLITIPKYRKLWMNTYPEVHKLIFWGSKYHKSTIVDKVWILSIVLGIFPLVLRIRNKKSTFIPRDEWFG